jgi:hypothetical protein
MTDECTGGVISFAATLPHSTSPMSCVRIDLGGNRHPFVMEWPTYPTKEEARTILGLLDCALSTLERIKAEKDSESACEVSACRSEYEWSKESKELLVRLRAEHSDWSWKQIGEAMGKKATQCSAMHHNMKRKKP